MDRKSNRMYDWWFAQIRFLSDKKKKLLRETFGSGKEIYRRLNIEEKKFYTIKNLSEKEIEMLRKAAREGTPDADYEAFLRNDIRFIPYYDPEYPKRLQVLPDMPYALYVKGKLPGDDVPTAGIVGARRCTPYGESMAIQFAEALAETGVQIISGMAKGIDGAAQRAALSAGGESYGILGCGVDICYPKDHQGLYLDLQTHGGILSEQPPGSPPLREYFPARNRIISGLSDVILVMEARIRSGSLITADLALEQGKDVYALPGPVDSALSRGCHELIRQGAGILVTPETLLEDRGFLDYGRGTENWRKGTKNEKRLEREEKVLYASIGLFPKSLDALVSETGIKVSEITRFLVSLEMKGYIKELSKNYFVKM